jgi:hypothetical protein
MSAPGRAAEVYYGHWCNMKGCTNQRPKNGMNGLCNKHHHNFRKQGDPLQAKIKLSALTACEVKTQAWINRAKREPTWDSMFMDPLRRNLESGAADIHFDLNLYMQGKAMRNGIRNALRILDAWHCNYTPEERLKFWLGIQYFYIHYPKSFASFEGYKAQVVQLIYRRSGIKIGKPRTQEAYLGKLSTKYPDLTVPRYMYEFVWEHLFGIFGAVAHHMNRLYNYEEMRQKTQASMAEFFNGIRPPKISIRKLKERSYGDLPFS